MKIETTEFQNLIELNDVTFEKFNELFHTCQALYDATK